MPALRFFLIIILILLQGLAPLVHAHVGEDFQAGNLHLPSLEAYTHIAHPGPVCAAINPAMADGLAIGIHSGIEPEPKDPSASAAVFFLLAYLVSIRPQPQRHVRPHRLPPPESASWLTPHNPRAPPAAKFP